MNKNNKINISEEDIIDKSNNYDDCEVNVTDANISSLIPKLPNDEEFSLLADFFSVFSDPTRLKIISALSEKELCVHELSSLLDMKQPSVSQHLKMLWQARVVKKRIEKIYTWGYEHVKE